MRRILFLCVVLCTMFSTTIDAKKKSFGNGLFWEVTADGTLIISGKGDIPNYTENKQYEVKGFYTPWDSIAKEGKIKEIIICEGVTSIGGGSFNFTFKNKNGQLSECMITHVSLPSTLKKIGISAFYRQRKLSSIELNTGLEEISWDAFRGTGLKNVTIPCSVKKLGMGCFSESSLVTVSFCDRSEPIEIEGRAFEECRYLQKINLPEGLSIIRSFTFTETALNVIEIPSTVTSIEKSAFLFCKNLVLIEFKGDNFKKIEEGAFVVDFRPTRLYSGRIINLPDIIDENNCTEFGLSKRAVKNALKTQYTKNNRVSLSEFAVTSSAERGNSATLYQASSTSIKQEKQKEVPSGLRYKGLYTISSQGRSQTTGGYTGYAGSDFTTEIQIYDDYILVGTEKCKFDKMQGKERVYISSGWSFGGNSTYSRYYVDTNYNIRKVDTFNGQFGSDWFEYEVAKGETTMPKYQPKFSGSSASGGGSSTIGSAGSTYNQNQTGKKGRTACRSCMYTNGKCSVCKGTGRQTSSAAGHSTKIQCRNCGGSGRCPTCGGDGWIN